MIMLPINKGEVCYYGDVRPWAVGEVRELCQPEIRVVGSNSAADMSFLGLFPKLRSKRKKFGDQEDNKVIFCSLYLYSCTFSTFDCICMSSLS